MKTSAEQYQMLTSIWRKWRAVAISTAQPDRTSKSKVEKAAKALYDFYGFPEPDIFWLDTVRRIPQVESPVMACYFRESLIFSAWHRLADPTWVCSQVGYDRRANVFRLPANKRLVLNQSRLVPTPRDRRRPAWLSQTTNVVSQFDVDALAILELAAALHHLDPDIRTLGDIIGNLVQNCFAAILFERTCLLVRKPNSIELNESHQLSAQGGPAIVFDGESPLLIYAVNGEALSINMPPDVTFGRLLHMPAHSRVLHISYMGWEEFYRVLMMAKYPQIQRLHRDEYGSLYRIWFMNQEIMMVRVKNRTAEPDGSYRRYVIPVDSLCRPLPDPNKPHEQLGDPQQLTALNAVASTFGMTGKEYAAILGAES